MSSGESSEEQNLQSVGQQSIEEASSNPQRLSETQQLSERELLSHAPRPVGGSRPRRAELLMPAGDLRRLQAAIRYGADAVYAGTPDLSLRSKSGFTLESLAEGVRYAHERGRRVYLTLNLFTHNRDVERLERYLDTLRAIGPDGVIVADIGVFTFLRERAPELELHVSTQANVLSWLSVKSWQDLGASLIVLAREVSFAEMSEIRQKCPDIRLEAFVHGAMCMTYSGRCLLSNYMAERGANQGSCAHSCRWKYQLKVRRADGSEDLLEITDSNLKEFEFLLEEQFRPGFLYPIEEDEHGSYILNSRDLNMMPRLAEYLALGIDSLKVEGRNKSEYYAAVVTRAYRAAIDAYYAAPDEFDPAPYMAELATVPSRGYTTGFHSGRLDATGHDYEAGVSLSAYEFGGIVREWRDDALILEIKNRLLPGDVLEFLPAGTINVLRLRLYEFENADTGVVGSKITAGEGVALRIPVKLFHREDAEELRERLPVGTIARKARPLTPEQAEQLAAFELDQVNEERLIDGKELVRRPPSNASGDNATPQVPRAAAKAPKLGDAACCGLGCNGCLPFWNDARYEKARKKLLTVKAGGRLEKPLTDS